MATGQQTTTPLLIVDEMFDSNTKNTLLTQFKGVDFVSVETDSYTVGQVFSAGDTVNKPQEVTKQLKGFNNKVLNRLFVVKQTNSVTGDDTIRS